MGFEGFLGNRQIKENLRAGLARNRLSHFYLISGPEGSGKKTLARLLSAAALCREQEKPCLRCAACRKVLAGTHPDVISVTDTEHKTVPVKIIRQVRDDMFIKPNEGNRKIYLFPQELGAEGQNALLKVLEEPPQYVMAILLTDNSEKILTTVRSRCTELHLQGLSPEELLPALRQAYPQTDESLLQGAAARSGGYLGQAMALLSGGDYAAPQTEAFVEALCKKNMLGLLTALAPMGQWSRDKFLQEISLWLELLQQALSCRSGMQASSAQVKTLATACSSKELLHAIRNLQKAIDYTQGNVSVATICSYLTWNLI